MATVDLKAVIMKHEGRIDAKGYSWDIVTKKLGIGIYRVSLKRGERVVVIEEQSDLPKFEKDAIQLGEALRG
jgi:hypothetical protein